MVAFSEWRIGKSQSLVAVAVVVIVMHSPARAEDDFALQLLGASDAQIEKLDGGKQAGLLEWAPVHLPINPPGDCNHYGWPVATISADTIVVMHRRIPGHRAKGAGKPHPKMSYGVVLCSDNGGKSWSEPCNLRDCMNPEDRNRGGIVPLSHRANFDTGNKSQSVVRNCQSEK